MSCGEETRQHCYDSYRHSVMRLNQGSQDRIKLNKVSDLSPASTALNAMIGICDTDYLVPLDADIILRPNAVSRILRAVDEHKEDQKWHSILFPLWDTLTQEKIMAL